MEVTLDQTHQEKWGHSGYLINMVGLHIHTVINRGLIMNVMLLRFKIVSSNAAVTFQTVYAL